MKMFRKEEGFTLVELMVVILIIGILIAIAIPVFNAARAKAENRTCHSNQRMIEGAYQTYYAAEEAPPTTGSEVSDLVAQGFIQSTPYCPDDPDASASTTGGGYTMTLDLVDACTGSAAGDHGHF